jgi:hypothetical protein
MQLLGRILIWGVGTGIPDDLILVHEFKDHYSLQPREEMSVDGQLKEFQ